MISWKDEEVRMRSEETMGRRLKGTWSCPAGLCFSTLEPMA